MEAKVDRVRQLVLRKMGELGLEASKLSREMGANHAYLNQYLTRGVPYELPEAKRVALAPLLGVAEEDLRLSSREDHVRAIQEKRAQREQEAERERERERDRQRLAELSGFDAATGPSAGQTVEQQGDGALVAFWHTLNHAQKKLAFRLLHAIRDDDGVGV